MDSVDFIVFCMFVSAVVSLGMICLYAVIASNQITKQAAREVAIICPAPCKLTFELLTLKVVSESRVTWATSVPILVFLGLSVLDLGPMYAKDRRQIDVRRASSLNAPTIGAGAY